MSDTEKNYSGSDKKDGAKKKDGKKDKKEKGYIMFDEDASDEELVGVDGSKSPSKVKKVKAFRFGPKKDIFPKVKDEKKDKEKSKDDKEKRKGVKKPRLREKKPKHAMPPPAVPEAIEKPVFGVPLTVAIERNKSHDGIQLPTLFRECIDYIEEHGLLCEGIYRISGVKSKVQHLKDLFNRGEPVYLMEHEPEIVASVLKQFLRELPEPVLTHALIPKFEEASTIRNERRRIEIFLKLINSLPECNKLLLSWMLVHMTHVIEKQQENKMTLQNVSIVLSPTMQISHRVLNVLFCHSKDLFKDVVIKRYVPPLKPATSKWCLELPDNLSGLEEELSKQESLLSQLHQELAAGKVDAEKEEQIWEVQRVCTQLKRKIKLAHKGQDTMERRKKDRDESSKRNTVFEEGEELDLELRKPPESEALRLGLKKVPDDDVTVPEPVEEGENTLDAESKETTLAEPNIRKEDNKSQSDNEQKQKVTLKELASQSKAVKDKSEEKDLNIATDNIVQASENISDEESHKESVVDSIQIFKAFSEIDEDVKELKAQVESDFVLVGDVACEVEQIDKNLKVNVNVDNTEENNLVTAETVKAEIEKKNAYITQEDATDSTLGQSTEDITKDQSSDDEFEHSLEEILEREVTVVECDKDLIDHEIVEKDGETFEEQTEQIGAGDTKTPVLMETPETPPTVTPVSEIIEKPHDVEEKGKSAESSFTEVEAMDKATVPVMEVEVKDKPAVLLKEVKVIDKPTVPITEVEVINKATVPFTDEVLENITDVTADLSGFSEDSETSEDESITEEEFQKLLEEEYAIKLEEEELLAIERELRKKIETERCESERLQQEIEELLYLRQDSDEEIMSSSSDSSYESEDEEDLQEILHQLIKENEKLEQENSELCSNIHKERMICLAVKVQIGILQQKHLLTSANNDNLNDKDLLIEFD